MARFNRVVVTGIGAVSPLGRNFKETYSNLLGSFSGATDVSGLNNFKGLPSLVAATVGPDEHVDKRVEGQKSRFLRHAMAASLDAVESAGLCTSSSIGGEQHGVSIGSGIGSIHDITVAHDVMVGKSHRRISPHFVPSILVNSASGVVSKELGLKGPNTTLSTACATGSHSIIDAYRFVRDGDASLMLAGGSEASVDALSMAGFSRLRALSTKYNDKPEEASRPFDRNRDGFVMGEGACVLVLESEELAKARGATVLAEVLG